MSNIDPDKFQQMLLQLRASFLAEVPEKLDRLEQLLVLMERSGVDSDSFNESYRIIHSLKGSGGVHGLHIITTICHQLEDLLSATNGGAKYTKSQIAISLNYVDLLRVTLVEVSAGAETFPEVEKHLSELRKKLVKKQFTVMIVDHSKLLTQMYLGAMADLPVRPIVMTDGLAALGRVLTEPFDLIITTNEIAVLKGVALVGALKLSGAKYSNVKTIMVTSNRDIGTRKRRIEDADYIIIKDANLLQNVMKATRHALSLPNDN